MKYLVILAALAAITLLVLTRHGSTIAGVQQGGHEADPLLATPISADHQRGGDALKQPLERTKAALQAVQTRNGDGEF